MSIYRFTYEESEYAGKLDDVVFHADRLESKISDRKYLSMEDRELLRNALEICQSLRENKEFVR